MEGDAVAAILQTLVQNLIDTSKNEISQIRGVDKEAAKLTDSLRTIQKFLTDAEMQTIPDEKSIKNWLRELEDAAFDADHVLDELNYHRLSKEIMKKNKIDVENPCTIMSQDKSREFLHSGNGRDKFKAWKEKLELEREQDHVYRQTGKLVQQVESLELQTQELQDQFVQSTQKLEHGDMWAIAIENAVGRLLNAFIVTDHKDSRILRACAREANYNRLQITT